MVTAPLLQQFEFEIAYDPPVSRPLTLRISNQGEERSTACGRQAGESDMGTVISFPAAERAVRGSRLIAGKPESATVIILPVIRIERYVDEPTGDFEPTASSGPRRRRRRRATRS
jgi:hypothetical protein